MAVSRLCVLAWSVCVCACVTNICSTQSGVTNCAVSEEHIEEQEYRSAEHAKIEMLQLRSKIPQDDRATANIMEHRYLLVRPCARFAGDGVSGLPRHRVTGDCCGDGICSSAAWESFEVCPQDCEEVTTDNHSSPKAVVPPSHSWLFGTLHGLEHDEYHCEQNYDLIAQGLADVKSTCSGDVNRSSTWLEDLLSRSQQGTLPFDLPPPGSIAVEFGAGEGQDSRNIAKLAGYAVTAIEVSPTASESSKNFADPKMLGSGPGQIDYVAYDALALPAPKQRVDFIFDATVYCGLRHMYLPRFYELWSRVATPGHTLVNLQCWNLESNLYWAIPIARRDMEADLEPLFDILHSESCEKNQGRTGWCFYMKLKTPEARDAILENRMKMQFAVRDGNSNYVREHLKLGSTTISDGELWTLYYIAEANGHSQLMTYLDSLSHRQQVSFYGTIYGRDHEMETIKAEDIVANSKSALGRLEGQILKTQWETREFEAISEMNRKADLEFRRNHELQG